MERRMWGKGRTRLGVPLLIVVALTACGSAASPTAGPTSTASETARPGFDPLIAAYGRQLATAAEKGPDALREVLSTTGAVPFDQACTPRWAHDLLTVSRRHVEVSNGELKIGGIPVPVAIVQNTYIRYEPDLECAGPLPVLAPPAAQAPAPPTVQPVPEAPASTPAPTPPPPPPPPPAPPEPPQTTVTMQGTLDSTLILGSTIRDAWPEGCHSIGDKEIVVLDSAGAIAALGRVIAGPVMVERKETDHTQTTRCTWTYEAAALPASGVLTFQVRPKARPDAPPDAQERINAGPGPAPTLRWLDSAG